MYSLNIKYLFSLLRRNPAQLYLETVKDIKKDFFQKTELKINYVWCIALPKSGSTIIEKIFDFLPYVQGNKSILRKYNLDTILSDDQINLDTFKSFPSKKLTFLKTHTAYTSEFLKIRKIYNPKIIYLKRNIQDMMLSRYFHILADKNHWQHKIINKMNFQDGFLKSCVYKKDKVNFQNTHISPIKYYFEWLKDWEENLDDSILQLEFEDFVKDKLEFIKKILLHINFDDYKLEKKITNYFDKTNNSNNLGSNLNKIGRNMSTFRSGKINEFKKLLDESTKQKFKSLLSNIIK